MLTRAARGWHYLAFVLAFLLLAILGWHGKRTQEALLANNRSVTQSLEVITEVQAMLSSLQDIETGSRGFILTGDPNYLEPYTLGLSRLEQNRRALELQLQGRDFPGRPWFEMLDATIAERIEVAAANIQHRRDAGLEAAVERVQRTAGRQLMDRLRGLLNAVVQQERSQLEASNRKVAGTTERSQQLALLGSLIVVLLFLAALWAVQRSLRIRHQLALTAQAGEARIGALLEAIPDQLYAVDARLRVSNLSMGTSPGPTPEVIEPLLLDLLKQHEDDPVRHRLWCEPQGRRIFEVRLVSTGLGDHLAIARDVTELERSRESLRDQEAFLRRVVDTDENLIFVRDQQGRFVLCNNALAKLINLQPQHIERRLPDDIDPSHLLMPLLVGEEELRQGSGELRISEVALTDSDGQERWLQMIKRPLRVSAGACHVVTVAVDISQRRRMEQMKTEFISTVSHELRTPLTSIRGALGMLVGGIAGPIDDSAQPLLAIAHKNSERLVRLINDILDIEKLDAGRMVFDSRCCDIRALVEQSLFDMAPFASEYSVSVVLAPQASPPNTSATVDPDRFAQVMANLLSNAIKHSPRGGTVTVDLRADGDEVEIGVQDEGAGIPDNFRSRIFQRFAQADSSDVRQRGGTGLGLAITRALVEQMQGQVGFESSPGLGSRFWFRLPLQAQTPAGPRPADAPSRMAESEGRILIVEPDRLSAEQLAKALSRHGYAASIASNVADAWALLARNGVDALTLSAALVDEDCGAFLKSVRNQPVYRTLPVLIVGLQPQRRETDDSTLQGGAVGVIDWLQTPFDPTRVATMIQACLPQPGARHRILHVEDDEDLRAVLARGVAALDVELLGVATLGEARQLIETRRFDLVILDLVLPDGSGTELFDALARSVPAPPVILFSALDAPVVDSRLMLRQLVKSRHDSDQLVRLIQQLLLHWPSGQHNDNHEVQT
ncbi:ATP-binding protein [Stutzerimonas nitrititolerans]|uniref:ATP-binding protein n=1 Tax=Stutzerimonas nitrititolerans TaxID=2482751 RepID=UPI00289C7F10|nr:ATP-binding protein [Stutzerimonas nitrititolerans]